MSAFPISLILADLKSIQREEPPTHARELAFSRGVGFEKAGKVTISQDSTENAIGRVRESI